MIDTLELIATHRRIKFTAQFNLNSLPCAGDGRVSAFSTSSIDGRVILWQADALQWRPEQAKLLF